MECSLQEFFGIDLHLKRKPLQESQGWPCHSDPDSCGLNRCFCHRNDPWTIRSLIAAGSGVHDLLLVQKKTNQKKRTSCENSSRPVPTPRRTILYVPPAAPLPRQNRLPPPRTGLNFRKGSQAAVRRPTEIGGGGGMDASKGYEERVRFPARRHSSLSCRQAGISACFSQGDPFGTWLLLCTSKEVTERAFLSCTRESEASRQPI
jgi:hypothetical protein